MSLRSARAWHLLTALVAGFAVVLQLVLVWQGHAVLDETNPPGLGTRVIRFASYLTIWSNVLVFSTAALLALDPSRNGQVWRALRLNAVVICFGGGIVHFFFLRPLLDLDGADLLADKLLHVVVPLMAVIGWLAFGPRGQATRADLLPFLALPVVWLIYTLVRGEVVDWYPYPFIDVDEHGYAVVAANCVGVAAVMFGLALGAVWLDRRLDRSQPAETPVGS
jgi:hypothetical protein